MKIFLAMAGPPLQIISRVGANYSWTWIKVPTTWVQLHNGYVSFDGGEEAWDCHASIRPGVLSVRMPSGS